MLTGFNMWPSHTTLPVSYHRLHRSSHVSIMFRLRSCIPALPNLSALTIQLMWSLVFSFFIMPAGIMNFGIVSSQIKRAPSQLALLVCFRPADSYC